MSFKIEVNYDASGNGDTEYYVVDGNGVSLDCFRSRRGAEEYIAKLKAEAIKDLERRRDE